jgi:beta-lactamase regulating signal transducer with metallopeptidase domain
MILLNFFARAVVFHILFIPIITLLAGLVLVTLLRLKKAPASLRAAISGAALIVILVLPWASMATPKIPINVFPATPDANAESLNRHLSVPGVLLPPPAVSDAALALPQSMPSTVSTRTAPITTPSRSHFNWYTVSAGLVLGLLLIWLLGVLWQLSVLVLGFFGIMRLRWSSRIVTETHLVESLSMARSRLDYGGNVMLLSSDKISFPITWGWIRSKIALPPDAENWPAEQIDAALLHELAHIKRRDFAIQTLSRVACVFHWYNPLVLRLFRAWKCEAEQACDDLVLRSGYQKERIHFEVYKPSEIQNGAAVYKQLVAGPIKIGKFMQDINESQVVQIENGKTTQVDLSLGKNAVIGKIAMPPGASADSPLTILRLRPVVPDPPYPPNLTQDQRRVWVQTWRQTPEGKAYGNKATEIPFTIDASGSFRINDVSPGNYQLIAIFLRSLPTGPQAKADVLGAVQRKFELGRTMGDFDLGTLPVQTDVR